MLGGRVAIVTGAGGGPGRSHALMLARLGAKVLVDDMSGAAQRHRRVAMTTPPSGLFGKFGQANCSPAEMATVGPMQTLALESETDGLLALVCRDAPTHANLRTGVGHVSRSVGGCKDAPLRAAGG